MSENNESQSKKQSEPRPDVSGCKVSWFARRCGITFHPNCARLEGYIKTLREALTEKECRRKAKNGCWKTASDNLLHAADDALKNGKLDIGWRYALAADRMIVSGAELEEQLDLQAIAVALRKEAAEKLRDWRRETVLKLLPEKDGPIDVFALYRALEIRDEHSSNEYYKISLRKVPLGVAAVIACAAAVIILVLAAVGYFPDEVTLRPVTEGTIQTQPKPDFGPKMLSAVMLFGIMGAALGAIRSLASASGKIPEQVLSGMVTTVRPLLGAAGALGVYAFLGAGLLKLPATTPLGLVLAVSFAAGFSEELLLWAVSSVSSKRD